MRGLTDLTGGLVGRRDPAQPLLTLRQGPDRVELSGATTANWVAKTANLLHDGYGAPDAVGLLPLLHWQSLCALLGIVASGTTPVVAGRPDAVRHLDLVLTPAEHAPSLLSAGAEVLVLSRHPLGTPVGDLPAGAEDFGREALGHGDHWGGSPAPGARVLVGEQPLERRTLACGPQDRVLLAADPAAADGLAVLLGVLHAGAAVVLLPDPASVEPAAVAADERATASAGIDVAGLPRLG